MEKLFLLNIIFFSFIINGQNSNIDLYTAGNSFFKAGNFESAIENYSKLLKTINEKEIQKSCFINRGLSYHRLKKFDLAITDFTKAIELDSLDMATYIDRGLSRMHAGYIEKAKEDFYHIVRNNNNKKMMEAALYWLSQIHYFEGKFEEVIKNCDEYFIINSNDYEMFFVRGTANDMLKNFVESIKDYDKSIELKPNFAKAFANRGTAKINVMTTNGNLKPNMNDTESACKDLRKAKELGDNVIEDLIYIYCDNEKKK